MYYKRHSVDGATTQAGSSPAPAARYIGAMHAQRPRPPVFLDEALARPDLVRELVERHAPYYPVQRYFKNRDEYGRAAGDLPMIIAPNFRGDWAYDQPLVEGVEPILWNERFVEAARKLLGCDLVRPQIVYSNITWQLPFPQGGGHTDVTAYRGIDRTRYPLWLLGAMHESRLFEYERIDIATAVAWFYRGSDGGFTYWPDGPDKAPRNHEGAIHNTAVMGDNDFMYHRVNPVGSREKGLLRGMTLDTRLARTGGDSWVIDEPGKKLADLTFPELRISVSWKAIVFRDRDDERRYDAHTDDIDSGEVFRRFRADFEERGVEYAWPDDPLSDVGFVRALNEAYPARSPDVFTA